MDLLSENVTLRRKSGLDIRSSIEYWHALKRIQMLPKVDKPKRLPKVSIWCKDCRDLFARVCLWLVRARV